MSAPNRPYVKPAVSVPMASPTPHSPVAVESNFLSFFYFLKKAEDLPGTNAGEMLGRVGSIIVCATFAGLLKGDPCGTPANDPLLDAACDNQEPGDRTRVSIIRLSGLPVDSDDVANQTWHPFDTPGVHSPQQVRACLKPMEKEDDHESLSTPSHLGDRAVWSARCMHPDEALYPRAHRLHE